jgi:hypothetical protein
MSTPAVFFLMAVLLQPQQTDVEKMFEACKVAGETEKSLLKSEIQDNLQRIEFLKKIPINPELKTNYRFEAKPDIREQARFHFSSAKEKKLVMDSIKKTILRYKHALWHHRGFTTSGQIIVESEYAKPASFGKVFRGELWAAQVLEGNKFLGEFVPRWHQGKLILFSGIDLESVTDDSAVKFSGILFRVGEYTYATAGGTTRTVPHYKVVSDDEIAQLNELASELPETAFSRTWSDKSGEFNTKATLISLDGNKVNLKKSDGKEVEIQLSRLSKKDQEFVDQKLGLGKLD